MHNRSHVDRDPVNAEFSTLIFKIHRNITKSMLSPFPPVHIMDFTYCRGIQTTNKTAARTRLNYDSFDKFFHKSICSTFEVSKVFIKCLKTSEIKALLTHECYRETLSRAFLKHY